MTRAKELLLAVMSLFQSKQEINNKALKIHTYLYQAPTAPHDKSCFYGSAFLVVCVAFISIGNSADYGDEMLI